MAAPLAAPLLAFLLGASNGVGAFPWPAAAARDEAVVAGVYADFAAICAASDPLIDALDDLNPRSATLARLASVADAVCAAAKGPDNPLDQAELVVAAIEALSKADRMAGAKAMEPSGGLSPRLRGRSF